MYTPSIFRDKENIVINELRHPKDASDFLRCIQDGEKKCYDSFNLCFPEDSIPIFPNACVPIAGIVEFYRKHVGYPIVCENAPAYLENTCFLNPLVVKGNDEILKNYPLNKIWRFANSEEINSLLNSFLHEIQQQVACENGVITGLTWCLSEVMDNVIQHSQAEEGFIMGQIHKNRKHIAFCIFDYGRGIFNSLKNSTHHPRTPLDAIYLSIKEGVTRDANIGQGNGMWGLYNIIRENSGRLSITSSGAGFMLKNGDNTRFPTLPFISRDNGMATIDFQIDFDKPISIPRALKGHEPVDLQLESLENDKGDIEYKLAEKSSGTGTRQSGERIRNEIINLQKRTRSMVEIDFCGIAVISSSFADEFIGKLIAEYGIFGFNQAFRLKGMNDIIQAIVNRSVAQRLKNTFAPGDASSDN